MTPTVLDKTKPFGITRGQAPHAFTQKVDGILFGFDRDGYFCYDPRTDPARIAPPENKLECNLPAQFKDKPLDESRPYSKVRGANISYVYMQDHLGFDANKKAVYADPGHWGVPEPEKVLKKRPSLDDPKEERHTGVPVHEEHPESAEQSWSMENDDAEPVYLLADLEGLPETKLRELCVRHKIGGWVDSENAIKELSKLERVYPMHYLRSRSAQELKALWFRHEFGEWRGVRGKPAAVKAIEELSKVSSNDL